MKTKGRGRVLHRVTAPGPFVPLVAKDWNIYPDKAALAGLIGIEGSNHLKDPPLPPTAFYDLVNDPIFGKVLRYLGGPHLNTTATDFPGRVASHKVKLGEGAGTTPGPDWWLAPNGLRYPTKLWVRQFMRFSENWTTASNTGGQGSADYKTMFLRYYSSSDRAEFICHSLQQWLYKGGGGGAGTTVIEGRLPLNNVVTINEEFGVSGFSDPHISAPEHLSAPYKTISPTGNCQPPGSRCFMGDREWYEIVWLHWTQGNRGEFTMWLRPYTSGQGTIVAPAKWRIQSKFREAAPGGQYIGVESYDMGINRNRQYDEVMYHDWGPYEVVDAGRYTNPWNVPV